MTDAAPVTPLDLPQVRLGGDVASRPEGLERALTRAGFRVTEGARDPALPPDAVLYTVGPIGREALAALLREGEAGPPQLVLFAAGGDPDLPGLALELGAEDAMLVPVHLPELCARIHARIRDRQAPRRTTYEREAREALETLVAEARGTLLPDEIVLALVRRLARAFDLTGCAFVAAESAEQGRIIAEAGRPRTPEALALREHPEIFEALRTRRPTTMPGRGPGSTLVLPVGPPERAGVLLLHTHERQGTLPAAQLALAANLGEAAARALAASGRGNGAVTLERRLQEEFERARRYSLSFALILVAMDELEDALRRLEEAEAGRLIGDVLAELRRTVRLPDHVSRYADAGFAVVLPETDVSGARRSVARIRDRLVHLAPDPDGRRARLTAGIVGYPHPAVIQADDMFALVEAALRRGQAQMGEGVGVAE